MDRNQLIGEIPTSFGNLRDLKQFSLFLEQSLSHISCTVVSKRITLLIFHWKSHFDPKSLTKGFSEQPMDFLLPDLIGVGSFGSLHKGIVDDDGTVVSVKVLNLQCQGASRSFIAEREALRNIYHVKKPIKIPSPESTYNTRPGFMTAVYTSLDTIPW